MTRTFWSEFTRCLQWINQQRHVRCVLLSSANHRVFSWGLDLDDHDELITPSVSLDVGRRLIANTRLIQHYQQAFTWLEQLTQPVIACVTGACIGGAIDLITACDIRLCCENAFLSVAEINIGMVADVGTLQRLQKVMHNDSLVRQWCLTGQRVSALEATQAGLFSQCLKDKSQMMEAAMKIAQSIADKSPLAVAMTKHVLVYSRDHSVQEGLDYVKVVNGALFQAPDISISAKALKTKQKPIYSNL